MTHPTNPEAATQTPREALDAAVAAYDVLGLFDDETLNKATLAGASVAFSAREALARAFGLPVHAPRYTWGVGTPDEVIYRNARRTFGQDP